MRRRFMVASGAGVIYPPGLYVSLTGSGNGSGINPNHSMSYANFQSYTLQTGDVVYFNSGDEF